MLPQLRLRPPLKSTRLPRSFRAPAREAHRLFVHGTATGLALLSGCNTTAKTSVAAALWNYESKPSFAGELTEHIANYPAISGLTAVTALLAGGLCYATQEHPLFGYLSIRKPLDRIKETYAKFKLEHIELPRLYDGLIDDDAPLRAKSQLEIKRLDCEDKAARYLIGDLFEKVDVDHHASNKPSKSWFRESQKYRDFFTQMGPAAIPVLIDGVEKIQAWFKTIPSYYPLMFENPHRHISLTIDMDAPGEMTSGTLIMAASYRRIMMTLLEILSQWKTAETETLFQALRTFDLKQRKLFNFRSQREFPYFTELTISDIRDFANKTTMKFVESGDNK